jgi:fumarate reductase subunit C
MAMAGTTDMTPEEIAVRRRRARSTAVKLALFAVVVYVAFIIAFINRH